MIVSTYRINYKYGETIKIKPIFDVHLGSRSCDAPALKKYLADSDESTYFFTGGDFHDMIIPKDFKRYTKANDVTRSDAVVDEQIKLGYDIVAPYAERWIGWGMGNHEETIAKYCAPNPTQRMADLLKTKNLGYSGLLRLILSENGSRGRTVVIRYHHGWGGGSRTEGYDLTKFSHEIKSWEADIFLYGHVHRRKRWEVDRLKMLGNKLVACPKHCAICGTYQKTYLLSPFPSYAEKAGYPPVEIGGITVNIKPDDKWCKISIDY